MDYTHSLLGGSGQLHSDFIINLKCERSSFCFLKYNFLLGPFISLKPRFHGLWNTKTWRAANDKWSPVTGKHCWKQGEKNLSPWKAEDSQSNGIYHAIFCPFYKCDHFKLFGDHLQKRKIPTLEEYPYWVTQQGQVCSTIPFCVGRVHLTSKKPVWPIEPIVYLASGASPRF